MLKRGLQELKAAENVAAEVEETVEQVAEAPVDEKTETPQETTEEGQEETPSEVIEVPKPVKGWDKGFQNTKKSGVNRKKARHTFKAQRRGRKTPRDRSFRCG